MAALRLIVAAALCAGCSAFVPQGHLRARTPAAGPQLVDQIPAPVVELAPPAGQDASAGAAAVAFGLAVAGLAVGVARAGQQQQQQRASHAGRRAVGVCLPLTEKWDPLNLGSTDAKMERYTAVEIKHGRISMIACIGYVMPEIFRFPGCESFENGLGALSTIPLEGWVQLAAFVGFHEVVVKPRVGGMGAFDLGFGTELLAGISEQELERRQTVERNNGRLAMVGILGLMVQDGMFTKSPIPFLKSDGWWGAPIDFLVKDIPVCKLGGCALPRSRPGAALTAMRAVAKILEEPRMSPSVPYLKFPEQLEGWVGGEKGFDPLGVTDALPVYLCREAELKHGRVCMLATLGWIATDLGVRFPGEVFQGVTTIEAHDKMVDAGLMTPFLGAIAVYEIYGGWLLLEGFAGNIQRESGDFFLGKNFLPKDPEKENEMRLKELENGRLAMLAFSGICTQAVLTGKPFPCI